jgi:hypothetical protein
MSTLKKIQFSLLVLLIILFINDFFALIPLAGGVLKILKFAVFIVFAIVSFNISKKKKY